MVLPTTKVGFDPELVLDTLLRLAGAQEASFALRVQNGQEGQRSEGNPNDIQQRLTFQRGKPQGVSSNGGVLRHGGTPMT